MNAFPVTVIGTGVVRWLRCVPAHLRFDRWSTQPRCCLVEA
ncbi:MAG: hypothetical protein ACYCZN_14490 [Candidatus Dormibacteria bacterium]